MKNYDNFFLPADDLDKGKAFYRDILELSVKFEFPDKGMIAFQVGNQEPAVILSARPHTKPTIWFEVDDVASEYRKLQERGVQFFSSPFSIKTGLAAEFEDPFGNRLGIADYSAALPR